MNNLGCTARSTIRRQTLSEQPLHILVVAFTPWMCTWSLPLLSPVLTKRRKMRLITNHSASVLGLGQVIPPQVEDHTYPLWIPYPTLANSQLSYHSHVLVREHELSRLTNELLPVIEQNRSTLVPDYRGARTLYERLLQWKSSTDGLFEIQCTATPDLTSLL